MSKKYQDPYRDEEAKRYDNPIPSRKFLLEVLEEIGVPVSFSMLKNKLSIDSPKEQIAVKRRLNAMARDAQLLKDRKGRFCLIDKLKLVLGTVQGRAEGYGFLIPDDGGEDYYISAKEMRYLLNGDRVLARAIMGRNGKLEAKIKEVVEPTAKVIGSVEKNGDFVFVKPLDRSISHNIFIAKEDYHQLKQDNVVVVNLTTHPFNSNQVLGRIERVLGQYMDPGLETDITINNKGIPHEWDRDVLRAADALLKLGFSEYLQDYTHLPFVTIDGSDAKDLDDAVYAEKTANGWVLYVAIAHVSYYVQQDTILDKAAIERGNSTYFPNRVIPMLPKVLSNNLCSLNPSEPKAALVCKMSISKQGKIVSSKFIEGKIQSIARLTYDKVAEFFDGNDNAVSKDTHGNLLCLYEVYERLTHQRKLRHALNLEIPETRIVFSDAQKISHILPRTRNVAHKLIEECMLAANIAVAQFIQQENLIGLFRNHAKPSEDSLVELAEQFSRYGINMPKGLQTNEDFANVISQIQQREDSQLLQMLILQSMEQAYYSPECLGHFGLGLEKYTHFTSPIRRYPDLVVHRVICSYLRREKFSQSKDSLKKIGEHCSMTERRSETAEREVVSWLKCEYMLSHVGNEYMGRISAVTDFGLFVTLDDYYVDGLVHVTSLADDYYNFLQKELKLVGERTGMVYKLGDQIKVVVANVDLHTRRIDFVLA